MPNPWDAGSARILGPRLPGAGDLERRLGGRPRPGDGQVTRDEALAHARAIVVATELPVSADLEKGFGDAPATVAETIRLAAGVGLAGGSIEDATGGRTSRSSTSKRRSSAWGRGRGGSSAAVPVHAHRAHRELPARIPTSTTPSSACAPSRRRAPTCCSRRGCRISTRCARLRGLAKPVNFMVGIPGNSFSVAELADAGVRRISLATSLYRAAMAGLLDAAREVKEQGTFGYLDGRCITSPELNAFMQRMTPASVARERFSREVTRVPGGGVA